MVPIAVGRDLVVGMIRVPAAPNVGGLVRLLANLGDLGVTLRRMKKAVDVDFAPALSKSNVLVGTEILVKQ